MNPHIEKLLSVCKEATPGEWERGKDCIVENQTMGDVCGWVKDNDARHITAFQPRNGEKLLLLIEEMRSEIAIAHHGPPQGSSECKLCAVLNTVGVTLERLSKEVE